MNYSALKLTLKIVFAICVCFGVVTTSGCKGVYKASDSVDDGVVVEENILYSDGDETLATNAQNSAIIGELDLKNSAEGNSSAQNVDGTKISNSEGTDSFSQASHSGADDGNLSIAVSSGIGSSGTDSLNYDDKSVWESIKK